MYITCRYGAVIMDNQKGDGSIGYTILHNSSCQHAASTYINLMNSAILRLVTLNDNMTIRTRNHPLPLTESQHQQRHVQFTCTFENLPSAVLQWFPIARVKICPFRLLLVALLGNIF